MSERCWICGKEFLDEDEVSVFIMGGSKVEVCEECAEELKWKELRDR